MQALSDKFGNAVGVRWGRFNIKIYFVNDAVYRHYKEENGKLIIDQLPEQFTLKIINEINPSANTALEVAICFYDALCTQCEAEEVSVIHLLFR